MKTKQTKAEKAKPKEKYHARENAAAGIEGIVEMVDALEAAGDDDKAREEAETTILIDPLSVLVRGDWHAPGAKEEAAAEFEILLCTGGPALRIIGELDPYGEPAHARLEYQDWGTPWTEYFEGRNEWGDKLMTYCRQFYFEE